MARGDPEDKKEKKKDKKDKDKKEKKDTEKKEKKDGKKEKDLSVSNANPPESPRGAPEATAPAPTAAVAPPPGPAPAEAPAAASPAAAPVSPIPAAAEPKEAAVPASPKREKEEKKAITRPERSKTMDDGIPTHARKEKEKEKEKETKPRFESVDLNKQSIGVKVDDATEGGWPRRSSLLGSNDPLPATVHEGIDTLWANFVRAAELYPDHKCFGTRSSKSKPPVEEKHKEKEKEKDKAKEPEKDDKKPAAADEKKPAAAAPADDGLEWGAYQWLTYRQVHAKVVALSSQFANRFALKRGDAIGIWSKNCLNWMLADLAANSQSLVSVSIYDTFGPAIVEYVLNHAEVKVVFCADVVQLRALLKVAPMCPSLRSIVLFSAVTDQVKSDVAAAVGDKLQLHAIDDLVTEKIDGAPPNPPKGSDLAVLMYTSGTTGMPKAVMQTHANMIALTAGIQPFLGINSKDVYLSYLPLAHIFEREAMTAMLGAGASIGFYSGSPQRLVSDLAELKPTLFTGVPRVFDRIYQAVQEKLRKETGTLKKGLFGRAYESRKNDIKKPGNESSIWNFLVFSKTKDLLGGRVRLIVSGGAPLSASTQEFLKICFCCPVMQGYGLTETCAGGTLQNPRDPALSCVGPPIPGVEIKLVEVADMGYSPSANPPTGEIWIRGPCVSSGYYKDEKLTASDFSDGWFHTGDVGRWNANGTLSIIDRKKNIFKLAQGEYVAAEKCEMVFARCQYLTQLFIYGDSFKSVLIGIGTGNKSALTDWAATKPNLASKSYEELLVDPETIKMVIDDLASIGKQGGLQGFELPKGLILRATEFTVEDELITPTFKFKRANIKKAFQKEIDDCYAKLDASPAAEKGGILGKEEPKKEEAKKEEPKKEEVKKEEQKKEILVPVEEKLPSPQVAAWTTYLRSVGITEADVEAYAQALAAHDFAPSDADRMSTFHLRKKPFQFSEANAEKIVRPHRSANGSGHGNHGSSGARRSEKSGSGNKEQARRSYRRSRGADDKKEKDDNKRDGDKKDEKKEERKEEKKEHGSKAEKKEEAPPAEAKHD